MPDLVTIGETCVVFVSKSMGRLRYSREFETRPGGAEATVAVGVHRLGHTSGWISRLGNDELGHYILNFIRSEGVDVSQVSKDPEAPTGIFIRERLPDGNARHFYYRNNSAFTRMSPQDISEKYIADAKILHLTGISLGISDACLETARFAARIAHENGLIITFDPNVRLKIWPIKEALPVLEEFMSMADFVLPGIEELDQMYGQMSAQAHLDRLHGIGLKNIVLKLGREGAIISSPHSTEPVPNHPVDHPADLMGAGDAFSAGFIAGLLNDLSMKEAAKFANTVAGMSVTLPGNIESLPSWEEVIMHSKGQTIVAR